MAKTAEELTRKVLQHIRTTKTNDEIYGLLSGITAYGEIAVQMGTGDTAEAKRRSTGLWTLANDGETAVRFPSEEWVKSEITSGASISVDNVIKAVGLQENGDNKGKLPAGWNEDTNFITTATTVIDAVQDLDNAIEVVSGYIESNIVELSGSVIELSGAVESFSADVKTYIDSVSGNIESTIITLSGNVKDYVDTVSGNIQTTILALDKDASAEVGKIVTTVSQEDGLVSETKAYLKDVVLSGYSKDTTKTGAIADTDTVNDALSKLENQIGANSVSNEDGSITVTTTGSTTDVAVHIKEDEGVLKLDANGGGLYTDIDLVKITTGLPETVKERYQLLDSNDQQIGVDIDVPKDSHIVSINYITTGEHAQNLEYVYIDASGNTQTTYVDMSELVLEAEFQSGVSVTDHIVHGVVANKGEFLYVDGDGFYVSGVTDAINSAIAALDVTGDTAVAGQYVAAIEETDGVVAVKTRANVSEAVLNNYSKGTDATPVAATDTVNQAISKLENQIDATKAAATTKVVEGTDEGNHMQIVSGTGADSSITYTISLADVASASALTELSGSVIELSGAVESIVEGFDSEVTGTSTDGRVEIVVAQADGKLSGATVTLSDIASASALTAEINRAKSAETAFDDVIGSVKGENDETRTYGHTGTNYLNGNTTVKADAETLDSLLGQESDVVFTTASTVAKNIQDIKAELAAAKLNAVDDDKYIATQITTGATGTTLGVSAITGDVTAATSSNSALVDSWDAKQNLVHELVDNTSAQGISDWNVTKTAATDNNEGVTYDFTNLTIDCGTF